MDNLPSKLLDTKARVVLVSNKDDCGIVALYPNNVNVCHLCFFFGKNFSDAEPRSSRNLADCLKIGDDVQIHAQLQNKGGKVPYYATSVWHRSNRSGGDFLGQALAQPDPFDLQQFRDLVKQLHPNIRPQDLDFSKPHSSERHPNFSSRDNYRDSHKYTGQSTSSRSRYEDRDARTPDSNSGRGPSDRTHAPGRWPNSSSSSNSHSYSRRDDSMSGSDRRQDRMTPDGYQESPRSNNDGSRSWNSSGVRQQERRYGGEGEGLGGDGGKRDEWSRDRDEWLRDRDQRPSRDRDEWSRYRDQRSSRDRDEWPRDRDQRSSRDRDEGPCYRDQSSTDRDQRSRDRDRHHHRDLRDRRDGKRDRSPSEWSGDRNSRGSSFAGDDHQQSKDHFGDQNRDERMSREERNTDHTANQRTEQTNHQSEPGTPPSTNQEGKRDFFSAANNGKMDEVSDTNNSSSDQRDSSRSARGRTPPTPTANETYSPAAKRLRRLSPLPPINYRPTSHVDYVANGNQLPPHTAWKHPEVTRHAQFATMFSELADPEQGTSVEVHKWINATSGLLKGRKDEIILFNVDQLWNGKGLEVEKWGPIMEVLTLKKIMETFPVGKRVKCNYRKVDAGEYRLQATAVWEDGTAPPFYRTEEEFGNLRRIAINTKHNTFTPPSLFSKLREGVIHEYISHEAGLVRLLDGDKGVALFAIDQVWDMKEKEGKGTFFLKSKNLCSLHDYLPIGSKVFVSTRSLPHSITSQLRHQVTLMWQASQGSQQPEAFHKSFETRQARIEYNALLDRLHDRFKESLNLSVLRYSRGQPEPTAVPVALNMLPADGTATIVSLSRHSRSLGLIKVAIPVYKEAHKRIKFLVLFHVEDLYGPDGLPYIRHGRIEADQLVEQRVDLIARSILNSESCSSITRIVDKLAKDHADVKLPILQAVSVFLLPQSGKGKACCGASPLPTFFRRDPSSLNWKQGLASFYFNVSLRWRLDSRVIEFLETSSNLVATAAKSVLSPFFTQASIGHFRKYGIHSVMGRFACLDVHGNVRFNYGTTQPANYVPHDVPIELPEELVTDSGRVTLVWLDRPNPKYAIISIEIEELSLRVKCLMSATLFKGFLPSNDLSSVIWCNMPSLNVTAKLVNPASTVPYVVTSIEILGELLVAKDNYLNHLKDEVKKVSELLSHDATSLNALANNNDQGPVAESHDKPSVARAPEAARSDKSGWLSSLLNCEAVVHKVLNANYGLAVGYQVLADKGKTRFFILFDACDFLVGNSKANEMKASLKDLIVIGDKLKYNAVFVDEDNSWNLNYQATSVMKAGSKGTLSKSVASLKPEKINVFKTVRERITKAPAPPLPAEEPPVEKPTPMESIRPHQHNHNRFSKHGRNRPRSVYDSKRQNNKTTFEYRDRAQERAQAERRKQIMDRDPALHARIKSMEVFKDGVFTYHCKYCGIQGMSVDDVVDHVDSEKHIKNSQAEGSAMSRQLDRTEAEEALFLNANKTISVSDHNGNKMFSCSTCKASNMSLINAKKHVKSLSHKKNDTRGHLSGVIDQECKEMRKIIPRQGLVYHCTPCRFQCDSIIQSKDHVLEDGHKRLTTNYCHVCQEFSKSKSVLEDHRFSIRHKKKRQELEAACQAYQQGPTKPKAKEPPKAKNTEDKDNSSEGTTNQDPQLAEAEGAEDAAEGPSNVCKYCDFTASENISMEEHNSTQSHVRRQFIQTGKLPEDFSVRMGDGERVDTLSEMSLIKEANAIKEKAERTRGLHETPELRAEREDIVYRLFECKILTQLAAKTDVRCNTCKITLQGKEKVLSRQLFAHITGTKHIGRINLQIKEEEHTGVDRNAADEAEEQRLKEAEEERANEEVNSAQAAEAEEEPKTIPRPTSDSSHEIISSWLKSQRYVSQEDTDHLFACLQCRTGLKSSRDLLGHIESAEHEKNETGFAENRQWRDYLDWKGVYEHGDGYFKCLICETDYMQQKQLTYHVNFMEHMQNTFDDDLLQRVREFDPLTVDGFPRPQCSKCQEQLANEPEVKVHSRFQHRGGNHGLSTDQVATLLSVSPSRNLVLPPRLECVEARVAAVLMTGQIAIAQVIKSPTEYINVLFDLTRVRMPKRPEAISAAVTVGYPVILDAVEIEPQVAGFSAVVPHYALAVTLGSKKEDHDSDPRQFATLKSELGSTLVESLKMAEGWAGVDLEEYSAGRPNALMHTFPDEVECCLGTVVKKNQNMMVVRLETGGSPPSFCLHILDSVMLINDNDDYIISHEMFEVGDPLQVNAVLMDPKMPVQYLVTGAWSALQPKSPVPRSNLKLDAIDLYSSLVLSYGNDPTKWEAAQSIVQPYLHDVASELSMDDIAADNDDDNDLAADDDVVEQSAIDPSDLSQDEENAAAIVDGGEDTATPEEPSVSKPFRLKIASFAR